jgi:hypothetical protein
LIAIIDNGIASALSENQKGLMAFHFVRRTRRFGLMKRAGLGFSDTPRLGLEGGASPDTVRRPRFLVVVA